MLRSLRVFLAIPAQTKNGLREMQVRHQPLPVLLGRQVLVHLRALEALGQQLRDLCEATQGAASRDLVLPTRVPLELLLRGGEDGRGASPTSRVPRSAMAACPAMPSMRPSLTPMSGLLAGAMKFCMTALGPSKKVRYRTDSDGRLHLRVCHSIRRHDGAHAGHGDR